jgi:hypothetical protein
MRLNRNALAALAGGAALLVGGGTAVAAQGDGGNAAKCETRLAKIAEKRGITVAELQAKMSARVDAALANGRISAARAARLKARIAQGAVCRPLAVHALIAKGRMVRAAARFLDLGPRELRAQLPGTSLAALAQKQGKRVEALEAAMVAPAKARLARAVATGQITQARADRVLERLEQSAARLAAKTFPAR